MENEPKLTALLSDKELAERLRSVVDYLNTILIELDSRKIRADLGFSYGTRERQIYLGEITRSKSEIEKF